MILDFEGSAPEITNQESRIKNQECSAVPVEAERARLLAGRELTTVDEFEDLVLCEPEQPGPRSGPRAMVS